MKILDLFCGAGGASAGYAMAGNTVEGVDICPQPHYPFSFHHGDALEWPLKNYDFIHASPPCQLYTQAWYLQKKEHPDLIDKIRERLLQWGGPFIIENVARAPLINPVILCGTNFDLPIYRHRLFECHNISPTTLTCSHPHKLLPGYVCIYGHIIRGTQKGNRGNVYRKYPISYGLDAMGICWMTHKELSEAVPPAYTKYLASFL